MAYEIPLRVFHQTSMMNCWFYAAKAVVYAKTRRLLMEADYAGGMNPAYMVTVGREAGPPSWLRHGLPAGSFPEFASRFHFEQPASRPSTWTPAELETALRTYGPLWFGGVRGSAHHVVVINGVGRGILEGGPRREIDIVAYGDPWTGNNHLASLDDFNAWKQQTLTLWNPMYYCGR